MELPFPPIEITSRPEGIVADEARHLVGCYESALRYFVGRYRALPAATNRQPIAVLLILGRTPPDARPIDPIALLLLGRFYPVILGTPPIEWEMITEPFSVWAGVLPRDVAVSPTGPLAPIATALGLAGPNRQWCPGYVEVVTVVDGKSIYLQIPEFKTGDES